jgi:hypothetical protein
MPCKSGAGTPKAKGDNPDRKSWSPRLGVGAVGQLPIHHKNINAKRSKDTEFMF